MRKTLLTAFLLALALVAVPAFAADAPTADSPEILQTPAQTAEVTLDDLFVPEAQEVLDPIFPPPGNNCNQVSCGQGQFCCNYSCSTCAPLGGHCTQQECPIYQ